MKEIWRDIQGFEGMYQVSNKGNIRSLDRVAKHLWGETFIKGQTIAQKTDKAGYKYVILNKHNISRTVFTHRLVAQAFPEICGEWFEDCDVHHISKQPNDNRAENLTVLSKKEHRYLHVAEP